jgi:3-oxoacyl-(acyl-carrier-protein) synthase
MLFSVLDRIRALAHAEGELDEAARPFDDRRNGLALGEGGAMFVAGAGTRQPYGWISGFGIARDTTASISDWGSDPSSVVSAMRGAIADAEIDVASIDAIYASANGSVRGDALEAGAIGMLFGQSIPPVVATKGIFGEYAAGGALQFAAALVALDEQTLHASCGYDRGALVPVTRERREAGLRHILVNSLSAGGGIVCAVLSREGA